MLRWRLLWLCALVALITAFASGIARANPRARLRLAVTRGASRQELRIVAQSRLKYVAELEQGGRVEQFELSPGSRRSLRLDRLRVRVGSVAGGKHMFCEIPALALDASVPFGEHEIWVARKLKVALDVKSEERPPLVAAQRSGIVAPEDLATLSTKIPGSVYLYGRYWEKEQLFFDERGEVDTSGTATDLYLRDNPSAWNPFRYPYVRWIEVHRRVSIPRVLATTFSWKPLLGVSRAVELTVDSVE